MQERNNTDRRKIEEEDRQRWHYNRLQCDGGYSQFLFPPYNRNLPHAVEATLLVDGDGYKQGLVVIHQEQAKKVVQETESGFDRGKRRTCASTAWIQMG